MLEAMTAPVNNIARKSRPLPRNTVENNRSSTSPSCSRTTPMNQRKAIPAKGTSWRLVRISVRRSSSARKRLVARASDEARRIIVHRGHEEHAEDDPRDRGGATGPPEAGRQDERGRAHRSPRRRHVTLLTMITIGVPSCRPSTPWRGARVSTSSPPGEASRACRSECNEEQAWRRSGPPGRSRVSRRAGQWASPPSPYSCSWCSAWAVASHLLARVNITGALVFLVAGYVLGEPDVGSACRRRGRRPSIHLLAELTLALLLFSDAARVNCRRAEARRLLPGPPARHRPADVDRPRLAAGRLDVRRPLVGPRRLRRRHPCSHGRRPQRPGDQRRADPRAAAPRPQRRERSERRHRHTRSSPSRSRSPRASSGSTVTATTPRAGPCSSSPSASLVGLAVGLGSAVLITFGSRRQLDRRRAAGAWRRSLPRSRSFALAVALDGNGFIAAFVAGIAFGAALPRSVADVEDVGRAARAAGRAPGARRLVPLRRRAGALVARPLLGRRPWSTPCSA